MKRLYFVLLTLLALSVSALAQSEGGAMYLYDFGKKNMSPMIMGRFTLTDDVKMALDPAYVPSGTTASPNASGKSRFKNFFKFFDIAIYASGGQSSEQNQAVFALGAGFDLKIFRSIRLTTGPYFRYESEKGRGGFFAAITFTP